MSRESFKPIPSFAHMYIENVFDICRAQLRNYQRYEIISASTVLDRTVQDRSAGSTLNINSASYALAFDRSKAQYS